MSPQVFVVRNKATAQASRCQFQAGIKTLNVYMLLLFVAVVGKGRENDREWFESGGIVAPLPLVVVAWWQRVSLEALFRSSFKVSDLFRSQFFIQNGCKTQNLMKLSAASPLVVHRRARQAVLEKKIEISNFVWKRYNSPQLCCCCLRWSSVHVCLNKNG